MKKRYIFLIILYSVCFVNIVSYFIGYCIGIIGVIIFLPIDLKINEKREAKIIAALSSFEHNDSIVYYDYKYVYYKNQTMRPGRGVQKITDNYFIYSDSNSKRIIEFDDGKRQFIEVENGYNFIYDNSIIYYSYLDKYYQYDLTDNSIKDSSKEEYYIHRDGSDFVFNIDDNKKFSISGSHSKTITIDDISNNFSNIPYLDMFYINSYQRIGNNVFIGISYYCYCHIVIQYDLENDNYYLYDWLYGNIHEEYSNIRFSVLKNDSPGPLNKYFIT